LGEQKEVHAPFAERRSGKEEKENGLHWSGIKIKHDGPGRKKRRRKQGISYNSINVDPAGRLQISRGGTNSGRSTLLGLGKAIKEPIPRMK